MQAGLEMKIAADRGLKAERQPLLGILEALIELQRRRGASFHSAIRWNDFISNLGRTQV